MPTYGKKYQKNGRLVICNLQPTKQVKLTSLPLPACQVQHKRPWICSRYVLIPRTRRQTYAYTRMSTMWWGCWWKDWSLTFQNTIPSLILSSRWQTPNRIFFFLQTHFSTAGEEQIVSQWDLRWLDSGWRIGRRPAKGNYTTLSQIGNTTLSS